MGYNFIDEANAIRFLGVNNLGCINKFFPIAAADDTGQPLGSAKARRNTKAYFGLAKFSVVRSIANIAGASQFAAAAKALGMTASTFVRKRKLYEEKHPDTTHRPVRYE